jgi:hypothetical protein
MLNRSARVLTTSVVAVALSAALFAQSAVAQIHC